ncbi:hypothetical protein IW261DRAFT_1511589 [Armillaria novae-zelandiae]|uniref:Uncharacterized protein n=1 Tax=Armillaria novae-zelandiae TaxID=153914 RepID=A0AA39NTL6_9AGAR|nr:hypothetical protein IW261DRAFT_1511589 [Armillaria novae-zelandiae]
MLVIPYATFWKQRATIELSLRLFLAVLLVRTIIYGYSSRIYLDIEKYLLQFGWIVFLAEQNRRLVTVQPISGVQKLRYARSHITVTPSNSTTLREDWINESIPFGTGIKYLYLEGRG